VDVIIHPENASPSFVTKRFANAIHAILSVNGEYASNATILASRKRLESAE
jgi:hypothetical protein